MYVVTLIVFCVSSSWHGRTGEPAFERSTYIREWSFEDKVYTEKYQLLSFLVQMDQWHDTIKFHTCFGFYSGSIK